MILSTRNQLYSSPFGRKAENKRATERQGKRRVKKKRTKVNMDWKEGSAEEEVMTHRKWKSEYQRIMDIE